MPLVAKLIHNFDFLSLYTSKVITDDQGGTQKDA